MTEGIWISLIGSVCTLIGVIVSSYYGNKKQSKERANYQKENNRKIDDYKDVTLYRIKQLELKQEKYNNLQERIAKDEKITAKLDGAVDEIKCELKTIRDYIVNDK